MDMKYWKWRQNAGTPTPEYIEHLEETDTNSLLYSPADDGQKTAQWGSRPRFPGTTLNLLEARIIEEMARRG